MITVERVAHASETPPVPASNPTRFETSLSLQSALIQPLLGGFNVTVTYKRERLVLGYSHGTLLNLDRLGGFSKSSADRANHLSAFCPYTTGFDVGIRITERLDLRGEWKIHRYDVKAPDGQRVSYDVITVGPSIYYQLHPLDWSGRTGLVVELSLRWWPTVYTSLPNDEYVFTTATGTIVHKALRAGVFPGVSVGWTFR
jgi:hypothetical protein